MAQLLTIKTPQTWPRYWLHSIYIYIYIIYICCEVIIWAKFGHLKGYYLGQVRVVIWLCWDTWFLGRKSWVGGTLSLLMYLKSSAMVFLKMSVLIVCVCDLSGVSVAPVHESPPPIFSRASWDLHWMLRGHLSFLGAAMQLLVVKDKFLERANRAFAIGFSQDQFWNLKTLVFKGMLAPQRLPWLKHDSPVHRTLGFAWNDLEFWLKVQVRHSKEQKRT